MTALLAGHVEACFREVKSPELTDMVEKLIGGSGTLDFQRASEAQLDIVADAIRAVATRWAQNVGASDDDMFATRQELRRLTIRHEAQRIFEAQQAVESMEYADQTVAGGAAVLDQPPGVPAVWGRDGEVLWAEGEPFLLVAPPGVGKTTLIGQVVRALLGLDDDVLGYPVGDAGRVLYIAADRPRQIIRSLRRLFTEDDRDVLDERLFLWEGPPPVDLALHPEKLLDLCVERGATHVILDSLKDMAVGISDDKVGAGLNRAVQLAIADGIEVAGLHHQRKGQNGQKPKTLEDVYGSTWITAGAGSVVLLWGAAGDPVVELTHLKQPAEPIGPLQVMHDHDTGRSSISRGLDVLVLLRNRGKLTSAELARFMLDKGPTAKVTPSERERARRKLDKLVRSGHAVKVEGGESGEETLYRPAIMGVETPHAPLTGRLLD